MSKVLYWLVGFSLIISLVTGSTATEAQAVSLIRQPYIQSLTTTSVVIAWRTNIQASSQIRYDFTPWADSSQYRFAVSDEAPTTDHALTLNGLFPNTTYYYCVESGGVILTSGESFHTARTTSNPRLRFAVISDNHGGRESTAELAERLQEAQPALLIVAGDLVAVHGGPGELDKFFNYFGEVIKNVPVFPCLGNHDWYEDNGEWYLREFYLPHNNPEGSELYYSFDYGNAHFISLCVVELEMLDWKEGSPQYNWLVNDFENTNQLWKFVYFHFPPYTSGKKYHDRFLDMREALCPLFEKYRVDMVFNGHEHLYERTVPMKDYYPDSRGVTYIVCGSFSGILRESGPSPWTACVGEDDQVTATIVDIDGATLNLRAVGTDGSLVDSMTIDRSQELLATMEVNPTVLTEKAEDRWFTVYVEPSSGYDPANMDINSMMLNNKLKPVTASQNLVDRDGDGLKERELKFDYEQMYQTLDIDEGNAPLKLTGSIDSKEFQATSTVYIVPQGAAYKITVANIDSGGGTVEIPDGQIIINFPQGAVIDRTRVIIRQEPLVEVPSIPGDFEAGSSHFSVIVADTLSAGAAVTIKVEYTEADIAAAGVKPELLTLLCYYGDTGEWIAAPTTVDTAARTVTVTTDLIDGEWILAGETGKMFGLPVWGLITILVLVVSMLIFIVVLWRYT